MNDKYYLDTNILVYLYSNDPKATIVSNLLDEKFEKIIISTQVINELINVLTYKIKLKSNTEIKKIISALFDNFYVCEIHETTIIKALELSQQYRYRYFDSLIIASALLNNCKLLYSEDLHDGQIIDNQLKIINPFNK